MIDCGLMVQFCSINIEEDGSRQRYGGGFEWSVSDGQVRVGRFWVETSLPNRLRLHLFGDTEAGTLGCAVVEIETPVAIRDKPFNRLHRVGFSAEFETVLEYDTDIENTEISWGDEDE